jgi:glycosyltransferase involved in cell wall biosynthesis
MALGARTSSCVGRCCPQKPPRGAVWAGANLSVRFLHMEIGFLMGSLSRQAGGLFESSLRLAQSLSSHCRCNVSVFGGEDEDSSKDLAAWYPMHVRVLPVLGPKLFGFTPGLGRALRATRLDLLNLHGIWKYPSVACLVWARQQKKATIVHPHGMLDRWAVRHHRWKKVLAGWAYENAQLRNARCIRALNFAEAKAVRLYGLKNPICIIPNGIDLPELAPPPAPPWRRVVDPGQRILLFLGRIHSKKGLPALFQALRDFKREDPGTTAGWVTAIVGWDDGGHEADLKAQVEDMGLQRDVVAKRQ